MPYQLTIGEFQLGGRDTFWKKLMTKEPEQVFKIEGIWTQFLKIDGVEYFNISKMKRYIKGPWIKPLPSDSSFRKDLHYMMADDMVKAQECGTAIINRRKADVKLRKAAAKLAKKNKK